MDGQQPSPGGIDNNVPFSRFFASRRSTPSLPSPMTPTHSNRHPDVPNYTSGDGPVDFSVDLSQLANNSIHAGVAHSTAPLYGQTGIDPLTINEDPTRLFDNASGNANSLAIVVAPHAPPNGINSNIPAKRGSKSLVQYVAREVASKRLKGEAQDGFIKWCSVSSNITLSCRKYDLFLWDRLVLTNAKPLSARCSSVLSTRYVLQLNLKKTLQLGNHLTGFL